jgi:hypothetical protein
MITTSCVVGALLRLKILESWGSEGYTVGNLPLFMIIDI